MIASILHLRARHLLCSRGYASGEGSLRELAGMTECVRSGAGMRKDTHPHVRLPDARAPGGQSFY